MEGLLRGLILYLTDIFKFFARTLLALALLIYLLHRLPGVNGSAGSHDFSDLRPALLRSQEPLDSIDIQSAGFSLSTDEPPAWLVKLFDRIEKARREVREQAKKTLAERKRSVPLPAPISSRVEARGAPSKRESSPGAEQGARPFERGIASFYGRRWDGRRTASGEIFDHTQLTAAHKTLPFGTFVRVVRKDNGKSVVVRINDRGPFRPGRIIDLSTAGARRLDMLDEGLVQVELYPATLVDFLRQFEER